MPTNYTTEIMCYLPTNEQYPQQTIMIKQLQSIANTIKIHKLIYAALNKH